MQLQNLGVVGYSTRALVEAAVDLGYAVHAIDAFADQDTLDIAQCQIVRQWPQGILDSARHIQCDAWLLAGGMEHHGRIVAELARQAPLLAPLPAQLRQLRSLRTWRHLAAQVPGLAMPPTSAHRLTNATTAQLFQPYLYKPYRSSGGMYVSEPMASADLTTSPRGYWQQRIQGRSIGVTTILREDSIELCGATESLAAVDWDGPRPYSYRGSIGPIELDGAQRGVVLRMAEIVRDQIGVRGWLQADFIEDDAGRLWLLEINPRWTAGMEVLHTCGASLADSPLAGHLSAYDWNVSVPKTTPQLSQKLGKCVQYAPHRLQLSRDERIELQRFRDWRAAANSSRWNIADVPAIGEAGPIQFEAGQPLFTVRLALSDAARPWRQLRQEMLTQLNEASRTIMQRFSASASRTNEA